MCMLLSRVPTAAAVAVAAARMAIVAVARAGTRITLEAIPDHAGGDARAMLPQPRPHAPTCSLQGQYGQERPIVLARHHCG